MIGRPRNAASACLEVLISALLIGFTAWATPGSAATMSVQGRLTAPAGGPTVDGSYVLTFSLYGSEKGGQAVWAEVAKLVINQGTFRHTLGNSKPLAATMLPENGEVFLGVSVLGELEMKRVPLHQAPYAWRAKTASALDCSGCLSIAALKTDADLNLGGGSANATGVTAAAIQAASVTAQGYSGDGSKLSGIKLPSGKCKAGQVVVGVDAKEGALLCGNPGAGQGGALSKISGGLLTTKFGKSFVSKTVPKGISDNNPVGTSDEINVPDIGTAKVLTVSVSLTNSDLTSVQVLLYDPTNVQHILHQGGAGKAINTTYPDPTQAVKATLEKWVGKNPKGKWRLRVIDSKYLNNKTDGQIKSWSVNVLAAQSKQVTSLGNFAVAGTFQNNKQAQPPHPCNADHLGAVYFNTTTKAMYYCDGNWRKLKVQPLCGNGAINVGEQCDDGNVIGGDGCTPQCKFNVCGDGVVLKAKEECDDGNKQNGDGCSTACKNEQDPQCKNYKSLTEANRNVTYKGSVICDNNLTNTWYRMSGQAGRMMPTSAPPKHQCGTHAPGWMQGSHPTVKDGIVSRKVCFHWGSKTCNWSANIQVLNCVSYFLYKLPKTPVCNLRYCGKN